MGSTDTASGSCSAGPKVGFLGLGTMGGPMCRRLVAAGYAVTAYDLDADALAVGG